MILSSLNFGVRELAPALGPNQWTINSAFEAGAAAQSGGKPPHSKVGRLP